MLSPKCKLFIRPVYRYSTANGVDFKMEQGLSILNKRKDDKENMLLMRKNLELKKRPLNIVGDMIAKFERTYNEEYKPLTHSQVQLSNAYMSKLEPRFTFGAPRYEIFEEKDGSAKEKSLPEIIFLGKCNSGKSTLLNNLITNPKLPELMRLARSSKVAGYTKMLNVYNISDRFKIVDSPGYGVKGKIEQGDVTMEYLQKRKNLRRVYLLASAITGLNQYDSVIIDFLIEHAIPFEMVWTKMDKMNRHLEKVLESNIEQSGILEMPVRPRFFFVNSKTNSTKCNKRYGVDSLKLSIMQACNLL